MDTAVMSQNADSRHQSTLIVAASDERSSGLPILVEGTVRAAIASLMTPLADRRYCRTTVD